MSYYGQNPINTLVSGMEALKNGVAARVRKIFADVDPEQTPLAHSIGERGDSLLDLLDGAVHAIAELEKRLPENRDKAA